MSFLGFRSSSRTILLFVLGVLISVVCIMLVSIRWLRVPQPIFDPVAMHQTWQAETRSLLGQVSATSSAADVESTIQRILGLHVASQDREMHLQIVLALHALERQESGAYAELQSVLKKL